MSILKSTYSGKIGYWDTELMKRGYVKEVKNGQTHYYYHTNTITCNDNRYQVWYAPFKDSSKIHFFVYIDIDETSMAIDLRNHEMLSLVETYWDIIVNARASHSASAKIMADTLAKRIVYGDLDEEPKYEHTKEYPYGFKIL